ncbi:MAG: hypothetical protein ACP5TJ_01730 [Candidatus Micrarchaeia archaeon]
MGEAEMYRIAKLSSYFVSGLSAFVGVYALVGGLAAIAKNATNQFMGIISRTAPTPTNVTMAQAGNFFVASSEIMLYVFVYASAVSICFYYFGKYFDNKEKSLIEAKR